MSAGDRPVQATAERRMLALERDPCPGDVPRLRALVGGLRELATGCAGGAVAAAGWEPVAWRDAVAHAVAGHVGRVVAGAGELGRSLEQAGDALEGWAGTLSGLQAEADALDREALGLRRRRDEHAVTARALAMDPVAGLDGGEALRREQVEADLRRVQERADDLHLRWLARSRGHAADLDTAAPPRGATSAWRGGWDHAHDVASLVVRGSAPLLELQARVSGTASTVVGAAATVVPPSAPVATPLSLALAGGSTVTRAVLTVGADGSTDAFGSAATATALTGISVAGPAVRWVEPVTGSPRATDAGLWAGDAATGAGFGAEAAAWLPDERTGARWSATVDLGAGGRSDLTVVDVAEPWQTGTGSLVPGADNYYAGVAVVTVPLSALARPGPVTPAGPPGPGRSSGSPTRRPAPG
ncbi:hypothetical protein [Aquipuribacter sp. MA13-6]|uniref:hypothetical protein n=1 Tax=unclassified Aquipuribacter TaxID=2635084 RepID=UPI003EEA4F11